MTTVSSIMSGAKLEQFIDANYHRLGNVREAKDAKIICIGERHPSVRHRQINATVINSLKGGIYDDMLLLEARLGEEEQSPSHTYVERTIKIQGWDTRDNRLVTFLQDIHGITRVTTPVSGVAFGVSLIAWWNPLILGISFSASLASHIIIGVIGMNRMMATFVSSNQEICKAIDKNFLSSKKIFVIGGAAHFSSNQQILGWDTELPEEMVKGVKVVEEHLKDKQHLILIPKTLQG